MTDTTTDAAEAVKLLREAGFGAEASEDGKTLRVDDGGRTAIVDTGWIFFFPFEGQRHDESRHGRTLPECARAIVQQRRRP